MANDDVPLDGKVKMIADALAEAQGPLSSEKMAEISEALKGLDPARAEKAATHMVALGLKLYRVDGEASLEIMAQLYVLSTLVLGEKGAAQAFEKATNYAKVTGEDSKTAGMKVEEKPQKVEVKGKIKRGLR